MVVSFNIVIVGCMLAVYSLSRVATKLPLKEVTDSIESGFETC